jgi:hypothetical protein
MSRRSEGTDFFDRARIVAATGMFAAGVCAIAGSILDWVTITPPQVIPADQADRVEAFSGLELVDGRVVLAVGIVLVLAAGWLLVRGTSGPGIIGALATVVLGGIAFADFRQVGDPTSDMLREMDRIGVDGPGIGLVLVATAAVLGLVTSLAGVAASPSRPDES